MQRHPRQAKNPLQPDIFADQGSSTSVLAAQFAQSETISWTFNVQRITGNVPSPLFSKSRIRTIRNSKFAVSRFALTRRDVWPKSMALSMPGW